MTHVVVCAVLVLTLQLAQPHVRSTIITRDQLPATFDTLTTYHYKDAATNPDSLINLLLTAGFDVKQAWLPLDNFCMGPVGPRFTVQLSTANPSIQAFHFAGGSGRIACASRLLRYEIAR